MNKIGYLTKKQGNDNLETEFDGGISTLQTQIKIKLLPNKDRQSSDAPNYLIYAVCKNTQLIHIGGAWLKQKVQISGETLEFLSISIDDMSLPSSLNVAAFPKSNGTYDITWRRRHINQTDEA